MPMCGPFGQSRYFAPDDERGRLQRGDSSGEHAEQVAVVDGLAADEANARALLERVFLS
jgi:hypothetical protein